MNIDKDIERCKELIKTEHSNWIGMSNQDAIENVLSELESRISKEEKMKDLISKLKIELETYKKIAEKLAEELDKVTEEFTREEYYEDYEFCNHRCCIENFNIKCKQCIIDWARKEVEKDEL